MHYVGQLQQPKGKFLVCKKKMLTIVVVFAAIFCCNIFFVVIFCVSRRTERNNKVRFIDTV